MFSKSHPNRNIRSNSLTIRLYSRKGFTLIELMVYMGLLITALSLASGLLFKLSSSDLQSSLRVEIEENGRFITHHLKLEIEKSIDSTLPLSDGQTSPILTLVQLGNKTVTFKLSGLNLVREKEGVSEKLNSKLIKISDFSIERIGDPTVTNDSSLRVIFRISPQSDTLEHLSQTFESSFILNL